MKKGTITFFEQDGVNLGTFPLEEKSTHQERVQIAEKNGIQDWSHYSIHGGPYGMTRDGKWWVLINNNGEITSYLNSPYYENINTVTLEKLKEAVFEEYVTLHGARHDWKTKTLNAYFRDIGLIIEVFETATKNQ